MTILFFLTQNNLQNNFLDLSKWKLQGDTAYEANEKVHTELSNKEGGHMPHGEVHHIGLGGIVNKVKVNVKKIGHEGYL